MVIYLSFVICEFVLMLVGLLLVFGFGFGFRLGFALDFGFAFVFTSVLNIPT